MEALRILCAPGNPWMPVTTLGLDLHPALPPLPEHTSRAQLDHIVYYWCYWCQRSHDLIAWRAHDSATKPVLTLSLSLSRARALCVRERT